MDGDADGYVAHHDESSSLNCSSSNVYTIDQLKKNPEMCCSTLSILQFQTPFLFFVRKRIVLVAYDLFTTGNNTPVYYFTYAQLWVA